MCVRCVCDVCVMRVPVKVWLLNFLLPYESAAVKVLSHFSEQHN